jgi:DNA mismatch repair protein MutS2
MYDSGEMRPLFKLQVGKPGSSFAFEIARKIGLSEDILQEATDKLGKEHIDYDRHLREIVQDKQYWESKRLKIQNVEKKLETLSEEYLGELQQTQKQRREIVAEAKIEAQKIIDEANKIVENTIREIRESQADKDKTKEIRKELVKQREIIESIDPELEKKIVQRIEKIKQKEENRGKQKKEAIQPKAEIKKIPKYNPGDKIRLLESGNIGEVIDSDKYKVVIALGNIMTTLSIDKIEHVSKNEIKKQEKIIGMIPKADSLKRTNDLMNKKLSFKTDIDVRGQRAEEALSNIQAFIDDAIMVRAKTLRILHGKGYGILKEVIRNYLKTEPAISSFRDEHVQFGGAGITIVEID